MSIKFPDRCIVSRQAREADMVYTSHEGYSEVCPHCKTPGLKWRKVNNTWRLFESDDYIHFCPTYTSKK